jgi:hypothetical protein
VADGGSAHGDGEAVLEVLARGLRQPCRSAHHAGPGVRVHRAEALHRPVQVGAEAQHGGAASGDELTQLLAQLADALLGERGGGHHGGSGLAVLSERHPVLVQEAPQVFQDRVDGVASEPVGLVEHHERHLRVPRQTPQIALVQDGVRVLLRVDDPHHRVDKFQHPVDLFAVAGGDRVVVRQVDQHHPAECVVARAVPRVPRDAEPV